MSTEDIKHPGDGWLAILDALRGADNPSPAPSPVSAATGETGETGGAEDA